MEPQPDLCLDSSFAGPAACFEESFHLMPQSQASRPQWGRRESRGSCALRTLSSGQWGASAVKGHCPITCLQKLGSTSSFLRVLEQTLHPPMDSSTLPFETSVSFCKMPVKFGATTLRGTSPRGLRSQPGAQSVVRKAL